MVGCLSSLHIQGEVTGHVENRWICAACVDGPNRGRTPWRAHRRWISAVLVTLLLAAIGAIPASAATTLAPLWTAGGLDAGTTGAGQAARIASDVSGNVAVVSGPSGGRDLVVTSYTPDGALRWSSAVSPTMGTFTGDWVVAAPNGDFVAVGHNVTSSGNPIAITMVRFRPPGACCGG